MGELTCCDGYVHGLQWRRVAVQALYVHIENSVSQGALSVWRCWYREDHAHGHVLRTVVSFHGALLYVFSFRIGPNF
jgi:hypothetical protein